MKKIEITPVDVRHKEFSSSLFGYSKAEVKEYLELISNQLEDLLTQKMIASDEQPKLNIFDEHTQTQLAMEQLQKKEELISRTLIQAENTKSEMLKNAQEKAENLIRTAELNCKSTINETKGYLNILQHQFVSLKEQKRQFLMQFKAELDTYMERVKKDTLLNKDVEREMDAKFDEVSKIKTEDKHD